MKKLYPLLLAILLVACNRASTNAPLPTPYPTGTQTTAPIVPATETPTQTPTNTPTQTPTATSPATPTVINTVPPSSCVGEFVLAHAADPGNLLARLPIGEAERVDILEISWPGEGFGDLDRAIIVLPRLGPTWQVNVRPGAFTIATRGFCGNNEDVAAWAVSNHVPSLQQASRDSNGDQPSADEIGVYLMNYEAGTLTVVKTAPNGPSVREVIDHLELSWNDGSTNANVPLNPSP